MQILKIILLDCQNNYVRRSSIISNAAKNFDILAISLSVHSKKYFVLVLKTIFVKILLVVLNF